MNCPSSSSTETVRLVKPFRAYTYTPRVRGVQSLHLQTLSDKEFSEAVLTSPELLRRSLWVLPQMPFTSGRRRIPPPAQLLLPSPRAPHTFKTTWARITD